MTITDLTLRASASYFPKAHSLHPALFLANTNHVWIRVVVNIELFFIFILLLPFLFILVLCFTFSYWSPLLAFALFCFSKASFVLCLLSGLVSLIHHHSLAHIRWALEYTYRLRGAPITPVTPAS